MAFSVFGFRGTVAKGGGTWQKKRNQDWDSPGLSARLLTRGQAHRVLLDELQDEADLVCRALLRDRRHGLVQGSLLGVLLGGVLALLRGRTDEDRPRKRCALAAGRTKRVGASGQQWYQQGSTWPPGLPSAYLRVYLRTDVRVSRLSPAT